MLTPTPEQQEIIDFARKEKQSLIINALAGAAKTTTLELIVKALPPGPILSLAFNKRIATEMEKRLPSHVQCRTLNSVGHRVWAANTSRKLEINARKTSDLFSAVTSEMPKQEAKIARTLWAEVTKGVGNAKMLGYIPEGVMSNSAKPLIDQDGFEASFEEEPSGEILGLIDEILKRSILSAYEGLLDFDDQIYMPTLFGGTFPRFPLVLVDEAQDLSPLNHAMLRKLVTQRLIAVGDPWQSIYAFRGAMTNSMALLREAFDMHEMTLSVSFRCPQAVVRRAWFRVPHMKWASWAIPGLVREPETWSLSGIPEGAAIICRNNAPLLRTGFELLKAGRNVQIVGADIGPGLIRILKGLSPENLPQEKVNVAIDQWEAERLRKSRAKASVADRADCLRVFAAAGANLGAAISYAELIFKQQGAIYLLSGHKAKGLEWDTVFHLDPWRIPSEYAETPEEIEQELNVRYVIETRAKKELFLVNRKDLIHV